jgi:nucleoside-diphosphate-sugar epimerase
MTTVAVTGAAGAVGRRLLDRLEDDPDVERVVALDVAPMPNHGKISPRRIDLLSGDLRAELAGVDVLVHLAVSTRTELDEPRARRVNINGTQRLLAAATVAEVRSLIGMSSAMVYGAWPANPVPLTEEAMVRPNPEFAYAVHRAEMETLIDDWGAADSGRSAALMRPTVALAEDDASFVARALASAAAVAVEGNNPPAQFLTLDDLADAVNVVRKGELTGPFNVAPDGWISTETVRALTGSPPRFQVPGSVAERMASLSWRFRRGPVPPGLLPYTMFPWVVANDRLRAAGWAPTSTNEEAYVAGTEGSWWSMMSPKRRQELALGAAGASLTALGTAAAIVSRRVLRARR